MFAQPEEQGQRGHLTVVSSCLKDGRREDRTLRFTQMFIAKGQEAIVMIGSKGNPD